MTRSARWLLGGALVTLAASSAIWLRPAPPARVPPASAAPQRQERPLSVTPAHPSLESAPALRDAPAAPLLEDVTDAEELAEPEPAEANPAELKPPPAEVQAAPPATAAPPARPLPSAPEVAPEPPDELP